MSFDAITSKNVPEFGKISKYGAIKGAFRRKEIGPHTN